MLFQILFTLFVLIAIYSTVRTARQHSMSKQGMLLWIVLWCLALAVVWIPESTTTIAQTLGIGRGVDVIVYSVIPLICFVLFRLHLKLSDIDAKITALVREDAIQQVTRR